MFCFAPSIKLSRVVPLWNQGGTGSRLVTRPASLRSQSRNDSYTVSVLVSLMHLLQVHYRFFIHGARVTRITGRSRPPGEVGLTPRQYTEWNVSGVRSLYRRFLSAGAAAWSVPYCQYWGRRAHLRPNAQRAMELRTQRQQQPTPRPWQYIYSWWCSASWANGSRSHDCSSSASLLDLYPALLLYLAGDALHQQPMGSRSHDCSSYVGCGGIPCSTLVSPNASLHRRQQAVAPGWPPYMVPESGFRPAHSLSPARGHDLVRYNVATMK